MSGNFDFMARRNYSAFASLTMMVVSVLALAVLNLNFGLDFTTGTVVEVRFPQATGAEVIRGELEAQGFTGGVVQNFGSADTLRVRMPEQADMSALLAKVGVEEQADAGTAAQVADAIIRSLSDAHSGVIVLRAEFVGPAVGAELRDQGGLALLLALGMVTLYIMFRFTGKFAVGAVVALIHDVLITVGFFALFQWTFDLPALAAVLAVIGYSLNDTIVVSDRIRENFRIVHKGSVIDVINRSLNQTLGRTLVTSLTTLLVLLALLIFGGDSIRSFAIALSIGVVVGTYSSIYVAANSLVILRMDRKDLLEPEKEGSGQAS